MTTCKMICRRKSVFVKWPEAEEQIEIIRFNCLRAISFPSVIGCVDSTHISIGAPKEHSSDYYNRKGYHSMVLQGICDSRNIFLDAFFGWPGRSHDWHLWENSPVGKGLKEKKLSCPSVHIY